MYEDLYARIETMLVDLVAGYDGEYGSVERLIFDCDSAIRCAWGELGPWETENLEYAKAAVRASMLRLAVVSAEKALDVSMLPKDEYEFGFSYGKKNQ